MMDLINSCFNMVAALFVLLNCRDIWKRQTVAGHTYPSTIFFSAWAFFSVYYFWDLNQIWTFYANIAMCVANTSLIALVITFRKAS